MGKKEKKDKKNKNTKNEKKNEKVDIKVTKAEVDLNEAGAGDALEDEDEEQEKPYKDKDLYEFEEVPWRPWETEEWKKPVDEELVKHLMEITPIRCFPPYKPFLVDSSNVGDMLNIISKVMLAWPEDLPGYDDKTYTTDPERVNFPPEYYRTSPKEKVVLWHAENFRQQYAYLFPNRRPLVIAPKNDCGSQKLYPTFINPTVLGFGDLYDCDNCVKFLRNFLIPEFLDPPTAYPSRIRSHLSIFKNRGANCYEFCIIAASFLIGAGYDAYVVDGYACKEFTTLCNTDDYQGESSESTETESAKKMATRPEDTKDATKDALDTGFLFNFDSGEMDFFVSRREEETERPVSPSKYGLPVKKEYSSKYEEKMEERQAEIDAEESKAKAEEEEKAESIIERRPPTPDHFYSYRTHAWILIQPGKRGVEEPFFLEPFTASRREISDPGFHGIETVFNNSNFWVNIQKCTNECVNGLSFDLNDPTKWSKLLYEPAPRVRKVKRVPSNPDDDDEPVADDEEEEETPTEMHLTMPVSWTPILNISQKDYESKYANGKMRTEYNDAIVELAAKLANSDGMVKKVIKFTAKSRNPENLDYIEEWFSNRKDKMLRRKFYSKGKIIHEYFDKGRKDALKEHVHIAGKNNPNAPRDLYYYSDAHPQGVTHRQVIPRGLIEEFEDRDDCLYYRMTVFGGILCYTIPEETQGTSKARPLLEIMKSDETAAGGGKNRARRIIVKVIEKYNRNERKSFDDDIAEKHWLFEDGRLRVLFHYEDECYLRNSLEFFNPKNVKAELTQFKPEDCIDFLADPSAKPMDVFKKFSLISQLDEDEKTSSALARAAEDEVYSTVKQRIQEDWKHEIEPDHFTETNVKVQELGDAEDDAEQYVLTDMDFTSPFFERYGIPRNKREELQMKRRIISDTKQRIIRKAKQMEKCHDYEGKLLRTLSVNFKPEVDDDELLNVQKRYKASLVRMHVLQERLQRHKQRAPKEYFNIIFNVLKHPKLNVLTNLKVPAPEAPPPELSEAEKLAQARLAALLADCCQYYNFKYSEKKAGNSEDECEEEDEDEDEDENEEDEVDEQREAMENKNL